MAMRSPSTSFLGDFTNQAFTLACPCCSSVKTEYYWAVVAPFIRIFVQPACPSLVKLMVCSACGHRFFSYRYTSHEMSRLYSGYRGKKYFNIRQSCEPWYGNGTNAANFEPALIKARQESLLSFLKPFLPADKDLFDIADLGGDAG